ncbi:MAG: VOC family protein [Actinobacteria bacterium]|nr:MAG: VOC family protein [Actinomycetota bacterium]
MAPSASTSMLVVTDVEAAVAFYRDAFGMEFALTPLRTATCERGSTVYGLYEGDGKFEGGRSVALIVDNLDETHEKAVAAGAGVKLAPKVRAGKRTAEYVDPDGNVVPLREAAR